LGEEFVFKGGSLKGLLKGLGIGGLFGRAPFNKGPWGRELTFFNIFWTRGVKPYLIGGNLGLLKRGGLKGVLGPR